MNYQSLNVLFVCSMNQWRSPTAEKIYRSKQQVATRSGGTSSKAKRRVTHLDINWADIVIVMENKHKQRLCANFPEAMRYKDYFVLEIEDNYRFMDPELVKEIKNAVDPILDQYFELY